MAGKDGLMFSQDIPQPLPGIWDTTITWRKMEQLTNLLKQDKAAQVAVDALSAAGGTVYIVGGAVRDVVLGGSPKDIDLMVTGLTGETIETVLREKGRLDYTGKQFGVYRLRVGNNDVEIAMPRTEVSTGPMHTDFSIEVDPNLDPEADLQRRDFTGNAMAYNPITGELLDPFGGQDDLAAKRLRLVSPDSFRDDPLRIVRALTSAARHGLEPDEDMIESMKQHGAHIRHLPGERIQMEMDKLLGGSDPARAIEIAFEVGLMEQLAPELSMMQDFNQFNPHHDLTVDKHTLQVLRKMTQLSNDPDLRLAALFHDSGKPDSFWRDEDAPEGGGGHFYKHQPKDEEGNPSGDPIGQNHEEVGEQLVRAFMNRVRYPNKRIDRVTKLVRLHMWKYFDKESGARRFLREAGDEKMAFDLFLIREADASGKTTGEMNEFDSTSLARAKELVQKVLDEEQAFGLKDLAVNGNDLVGLGMEGPEIGKALNMLLEVVLSDPSLNTRENLLAVLQDASPREAKTAANYVEVSQEPWWKWSYDGKKLDIWRVNPKTGRPHHIERTGPRFYLFAQGRVYVDWNKGDMLGSQHKDFIEIVVWEDRGTQQLQDAAVQAVEQFIWTEFDRTADEVSYQDEGIDWTQLGRDPTESEMDRHYWQIQDERPFNDGDDPEEENRSIHDLTEYQWQLMQDDDSPYAYLDDADHE